MKVARLLSLAVFAAGLVTLALAAACGGAKKASPELTPTTAPSETATATSSNTPTRTATATASPTPTATPTPFAGAVARFKFPRLGVDAPIEDLAINSRDELDTPKDTNRAVGWYYIYDRPGWNGNAVFSAHVYYHNVPAPFQKLSQSKAGDDIVIAMENGLEYKYRVVSNKRYHRDTIPMGDIIWPQDRPGGVEWITLITCGGELDSTGQEYISRDVVVAERYQ